MVSAPAQLPYLLQKAEPAYPDLPGIGGNLGGRGRVTHRYAVGTPGMSLNDTGDYRKVVPVD